jgi:serine/threonine protein kinase
LQRLSRFGFTLKGLKGSHTFFCKTKEQRKNWFQQLKKVCILSHLKAKYNRRELLGKGTFAKVYYATRKKDKTKFAIKNVKKKFLYQTMNNMKCLIKGIRALRCLDHPNIIKLHEIYESANYIHIVLEYINGEDLFSHLKHKGVYSEKDSSLVIMQVLEALKYCHSLNVIHRDLKPENLMIVYYL